MSGGYFDHNQFRIGIISEYIEEIIRNNDSKDKGRWGDHIGCGFSKETILKFKEAVISLKITSQMVHRIDYLLSGDDDEESFLKRWEEEIENK